MYIADIVLKLVRFLLQKIVYPLLPVNMPILTYDALVTGLLSIEHNLNWSFAGLDKFVNLGLLFTVLIVMITGEMIFWLVRAGKWIIEIVRG